MIIESRSGFAANSQTDTERDAHRYNKIVKSMSKILDRMQAQKSVQGQHVRPVEVLHELMIDLVSGFDATRVFVIEHRDFKSYSCKLIHGTDGLTDELARNFVGKPFTSSILDQTIAANEAIVVEFLQEQTDSELGGLSALCGGGSLILVPCHFFAETLIIGCIRDVAFPPSENDMGPFLASERTTLELLINLVSMVTHVREQERDKSRLRALQDATNVISRAGLGQNAILNAILELATRVTGTKFATIQLKRDNGLVFEAAYPMPRLAELRRKIGIMPIDGPGITARAMRLNDALFVRDVRADPDFVPFNQNTSSELAVIIRDNQNNAVGVLNIEYQSGDPRGEEDRVFLIGLAGLASLALHNTETAAELGYTRFLAIMGAWDAEAMDNVNTELGNIRRLITILGTLPGFPDDAVNLLQDIDAAAERMRLIEEEFPDQPVLPGTVRNPALVDRVVGAEVSIAQAHEAGIKFELHLACSGVYVAMEQQWIGRLLQHYLKNAVHAFKKSNTPRDLQRVVVRTELRGAMVAVQVEDNGKGVREEIKDRLFFQPVAHVDGDSRPPGLGLTLVKFIAKTYQGDARLVHSDKDEGSCFEFTIPVSPTDNLTHEAAQVEFRKLTDV